MFKKMIKWLTLYSGRALACWGEFGPLESWPAVRANADLTNFKYRIMRFDAAQTCNVASNDVSAAPTEVPVGVLQNNPASGQAANIAYFGHSKVMAGAAITARAYITTNGSGKAVAATSGDMTIGIAVEAAGATDEIISALLFPPVRGGSVA